MALEQILNALEAEAERQIQAIEADLETQIAQLNAEAAMHAAQVRLQAMNAVVAPLAGEQARILNRAKQEALQLVLGQREELMAAALAAASERLAKLCTTDAYPDLLRQLTREAVDMLEHTDGLHMEVRPADLDVMQRILRDLNLAATVQGTIDGLDPPDDPGCPGGVVVSTGDGRIRLDNRLATRLRRIGELHRTEIAAELFGAHEEE